MKVFNVPCAGGRGIFGKIGSSSTHFAAGLTMTSFARCLPLLLLLLGAPVALGGESCPQPSEGTACQTIYDPGMFISKLEFLQSCAMIGMC